MDIKLLDNVLEALLFVSGEGLNIEEVARNLEVQKSEIQQSVQRLKAKYSEKCGINLIIYNGNIQFGSNPEYADEVAKILNPIREKMLTSATLEAVAIIAYRQPITRLEVEKVRGVSSDYAIGVLLKNNLIEVVGRKDAVGKPLLFGTTDEFLKRFCIESIDELPDYDQLLDSIKLINEQNNPDKTSSLFNKIETNHEEEKPDFLDGEDVLKVE